MKLNSSFNYIFLVLILLVSCKREVPVQPKTYPVFITKPVTNINKNGAVFNAELINAGTSEIVDFGFRWWFCPDKRFESSLKEKGGSMEDFSLHITEAIRRGYSYKVQAYAKTAENTIYGDEVTFKGAGSTRPVIDSFFPKSGNDGDTITITGSHFSSFDCFVMINDVQVNVLYSDYDSIVFVLPESSLTGDVTIGVIVGCEADIADELFKITNCEITSLSSLTGYSGNIITIYGNRFLTSDDNRQVLFGDTQSEIISLTDNQIDVIVPYIPDNENEDKELNVAYKTSTKTAVFYPKFKVKYSWSEKAPTPLIGKWSYNTFAYNNKGYIYNQSNKKLYEYDPINDAWDILHSSEFPGDNNLGSICVLGDELYMFGGLGSGSNSKQVWVYNFINSTWTRKNDLPFTFIYAVLFCIDDFQYVVTHDSKMWKCDFRNETYINLDDTPFNFEYNKFGVSFKRDNNAYVVIEGETWLFDHQNNNWIRKADNSFNGALKLGFTYNNTGFVMQGANLYKYFEEIDKWVHVNVYPYSYSGGGWDKGCFVINNTAYIPALEKSWGDLPFMFSYKE